ncbi:MAG: DinB family protein [Thermaerobacterales bacterium]
MDPKELAEQLDNLFARDQNFWHIPLISALKEINADEAAWRPAGWPYSIWDIVQHVMYWEAVVLGWFRGESKRPVIEREGVAHDWPAIPDPPSAEAWEAAWDALCRGHEHLIDAVNDATPEQLAAPSPGRKRSLGFFTRGLVGHTSYHCGQIVLLKRLRSLHA